MKHCYVYWYHLIEHKDKHVEGYIGVTSNLAQRHYAHSTGRTNSHLANAFNKYGDDIVKDILFTGTIEECLAYELALRPIDNLGWNIVKGGGKPPQTVSHSEETKRKIGESNKGKNLSRTSIFKGMTNRHSDEMKEYLGSFHKGKTISNEHKQAIRDKMSGSNSPKATPIKLYHKDNSDVILEFGSTVEASKELGLNYASLRSQRNNKRTNPNRKGWAIVYDD